MHRRLLEVGLLISVSWQLAKSAQIFPSSVQASEAHQIHSPPPHSGIPAPFLLPVGLGCAGVGLLLVSVLLVGLLWSGGCNGRACCWCVACCPGRTGRGWGRYTRLATSETAAAMDKEDQELSQVGDWTALYSCPREPGDEELAIDGEEEPGGIQTQKFRRPLPNVDSRKPVVDVPSRLKESNMSPRDQMLTESLDRDFPEFLAPYYQQFHSTQALNQEFKDKFQWPLNDLPSVWSRVRRESKSTSTLHPPRHVSSKRMSIHQFFSKKTTLAVSDECKKPGDQPGFKSGRRFSCDYLVGLPVVDVNTSRQSIGQLERINTMSAPRRSCSADRIMTFTIPEACEGSSFRRSNKRERSVSSSPVGHVNTVPIGLSSCWDFNVGLDKCDSSISGISQTNFAQIWFGVSCSKQESEFRLSVTIHQLHSFVSRGHKSISKFYLQVKLTDKSCDSGRSSRSDLSSLSLRSASSYGTDVESANHNRISKWLTRRRQSSSRSANSTSHNPGPQMFDQALKTRIQPGYRRIDFHERLEFSLGPVNSGKEELQSEQLARVVSSLHLQFRIKEAVSFTQRCAVSRPAAVSLRDLVNPGSGLCGQDWLSVCPENWVNSMGSKFLVDLMLSKSETILRCGLVDACFRDNGSSEGQSTELTIHFSLLAGESLVKCKKVKISTGLNRFDPDLSNHYIEFNLPSAAELSQYTSLIGGRDASGRRQDDSLSSTGSNSQQLVEFDNRSYLAFTPTHFYGKSTLSVCVVVTRGGRRGRLHLATTDAARHSTVSELDCRLFTGCPSSRRKVSSHSASRSKILGRCIIGMALNRSSNSQLMADRHWEAMWNAPGDSVQFWHDFL